MLKIGLLVEAVLALMGLAEASLAETIYNLKLFDDIPTPISYSFFEWFLAYDSSRSQV